MLAVQSINFACMDFWSPYLAKMGAEIRVSVADVDTIPYSARIGLPVRQYIMEAGEVAQKPIQRPRTKSTETNSQKTDGMTRDY